MGRSKVIVKSIEDPVKRKATFMKRKGGVMKKAMEISVLCNCEIALVLFDEHGDMFQFASKDMRQTLKRAFNHKGKKDVKNNDALLRTHGVTKQRFDERSPVPEPSQFERIDMTPAAACGLKLSAGSFGTMLKGVDLPESPPALPPSSPTDDTFDIKKECTEDDCKTPSCGPSFDPKLPPRVQRSVDTLMKDISLMAKADDLLHDPWAMEVGDNAGDERNSRKLGFMSVRPAPPAAIW
eukprot:COSAG05_NODE_732_length_7656_cov_6.636628_2_plen_238_part_00